MEPNAPFLRRDATPRQTPVPCAGRMTLATICYAAATILPSARSVPRPSFVSPPSSPLYLHILTLKRVPPLTALFWILSHSSTLIWYGPGPSHASTSNFLSPTPPPSWASFTPPILPMSLSARSAGSFCEEHWTSLQRDTLLSHDRHITVVDCITMPTSPPPIGGTRTTPHHAPNARLSHHGPHV